MTNGRANDLAELLASTAEGRDIAWHASLLDALDGVTPEQARWRPGPDRNSIWDLVRHLAHWKRALLAAWETGDLDHDAWERTDWAPVPEDAVWEDDLRTLVDVSRRLAATLAAGGDALFEEGQVGFRGSVLHNAMHVATHDAYHAGQIRLLLRLQADA